MILLLLRELFTRVNEWSVHYDELLGRLNMSLQQNNRL